MGRSGQRPKSLDRKPPPAPLAAFSAGVCWPLHQLSAGTRAFKLPAGALVLYPANSLHQVVKVRSGRRDVAVGWLQSLVREQRA